MCAALERHAGRHTTNMRMEPETPRMNVLAAERHLVATAIKDCLSCRQLYRVVLAVNTCTQKDGSDAVNKNVDKLCGRTAGNTQTESRDG